MQSIDPLGKSLSILEAAVGEEDATAWLVVGDGAAEVEAGVEEAGVEVGSTEVDVEDVDEGFSKNSAAFTVGAAAVDVEVADADVEDSLMRT